MGIIVNVMPWGTICPYPWVVGRVSYILHVSHDNDDYDDGGGDNDVIAINRMHNNDDDNINNINNNNNNNICSGLNNLTSKSFALIGWKLSTTWHAKGSEFICT